MFFPATEEHPELVCAKVKGVYSIHYVIGEDSNTGEKIIRIEYDPADIKYFILKSDEWTPWYLIACKKLYKAESRATWLKNWK